MRQGGIFRYGWTAVLAVALLANAWPQAARAEDPDPPPAKPNPAPRERPMPPYKHPYEDGLYSTIVAMISIGAPEIEKQKSFKLDVPGFKKDLKVKAILQDKPAPLVVVLVGVDGKADTPLGRLFPWWLNDAGYHVLSFDSTFRPTFMETARTGVTGNLNDECEQIAKIIDTFLKLEEVKKKVTKIGVAGYSLGGTQAMILARMSADKKLPFELSGAVAFSPLIKLRSSAAILDDMYAKDRYKYTMIDMGKQFMTHEPVPPGEKVPFEPAFMRAGIGFLVREEFTDIVDRNDETWRLKLLPSSESGENRRSYAEVEWGFTKFMEKMSFPYWKGKGSVKSIDEMWAMGDLTQVMKSQPAFSRAMICANDPLNAAEDLEELKKSADPKNLEVVPNGGHLGYLGTYWAYAHLVRLFGFQ
ncbi:MAG: alpha/beta fold hydrolase [Planctomycetota bacterium]|nr:alpha/beta fold hydrolase [Planctomycetota bacterium]